MDGELQGCIRRTWLELRRSALDSAPDPKIGGEGYYLYIPAGEDRAHIQRLVHQKNPQSALEIRYLPDDVRTVKDHGILYLPNDYVVPGGRFNEMYGWDSYWIIIGLLRDNFVDLAKGMVENFFYQIEHYGGKILNANRTYYLTRSQPPLLGPMVLAVAGHLEGEERHAFLTRAVATMAVNYTGFWKTRRYTQQTGLFRYGHPDQGTLGLCPEVVHGERDMESGLSHYDKIALYLKNLPAVDPVRLRFYNEATGSLTPEAIAGDRGLRESGFDPSMHMGYYGLETLDYNPVCLNSLLHRHCCILSNLNEELGNMERALEWNQEATRLYGQIQRYLWNAEKGLFMGYNHREERSSDFLFLTSAYPLWAGIATAEQAQGFQDNLNKFETGHGTMNTPHETGCQWDGPFMWAPLVYFLVNGLHNYNFAVDALRVGQKFMDTVTHIFNENGTIYEKYNARDRSTATASIRVGYAENVTGFGWTNGTMAYS